MSPTATTADTLTHPAQQQRDATALAKAKNTVKYMLDPQTGPQPTRLRTRAFLRSARYILIFAFWRLVRYAKYAAIGAITAAVAGTMIGSVASGAAFVIAPTGILGGAGVGLLWGVGKYGWRAASRRVHRGHKSKTGDPRTDEHLDAEGQQPQAEFRAPRSDPW